MFVLEDNSVSNSANMLLLFMFSLPSNSYLL